MYMSILKKITSMSSRKLKSPNQFFFFLFYKHFGKSGITNIILGNYNFTLFLLILTENKRAFF